MKKLQKALVTALSLTAIFSAVGCMQSVERTDEYYDGYGNYPFQGPRHMLVRQKADGRGNVEYITVDNGDTKINQSDVARYHKGRYKPMNQNQQINQSNGYGNVNQNSDGMYFVEHDQAHYKSPQKSSNGQMTWWWNTYNYNCGYNGMASWGYYSYNSYCNYGGWNHYYAPYSYNWYYNWSWRPTYYYNNSFWYYAQGWNNWYYYGGYNYYYFWMPGYNWF